MVECCNDGCPSVRLSHLHKDLIHSDPRVFGYLSIQGPKSSLLSFDGQPDLGRLFVVPYFFHLRMLEATPLLGSFNAAENALDPSPDLCHLLLLLLCLMTVGIQ